MTRTLLHTLAAVVALALALPAVADADVPWAEGVSQERQSQANALFAEANQLFGEQAHAPALDKYRAALALWDHPLIEFNMAVTLVRLDRIVEAADALDKALAYGEAPFPSPEQFQQALDYQRLVAGRVGAIEATCTQRGAMLTLDGKPWFTCPGTQKKRVLVGNHVITGKADGYMTITQTTLVTGGGTTSGSYTFLPIATMVEFEYPTPRWVPWTVAGGGVAVALGGLAFWLAGNDRMDRFRDDYNELCPDGCSKDLDANATERQLAAQRDHAYRANHVGIALMTAGGAVAVGGAVWAFLNRPRRVLPELEVQPAAGGASARASWRF